MEGSENIDNVDCSLCRSEIVMVAGVESGAAYRAWIFVIVGVYPAYPEFGLKIPMPVEDPAVAVCDAGATHPALEAVVAQLPEVSAEELEPEGEVAEVVLSADEVRPQEMAGERLAEPEAGLWLHAPLFPAVLVDFPEVDVAGDVERPLRCELDFQAQVGSQEGIV